MSAEDALTLLRARWQVERLFTRWQRHGRLAAWRSANPRRIVCEVDATLPAALVQHRCLLLACWADPCRSPVKAAATVRRHARVLAGARGRPATAKRLLALAPPAPAEEAHAA